MQLCLRKGSEITLFFSKHQLKAQFSCLEHQMVALCAVYTVAIIFTLLHSEKCLIAQ